MRVVAAVNVAWMWLTPMLLVGLVATVQWLPLLDDGGTVFSAGGPRPYTPLELRGRDIYMREGCSGCHSQLVRPLPGDVMRYGTHSEGAHTHHDRPTQLGNRRLGPDLSHIGGKYPDHWHVRHLSDPRQVIAASNMPAFPWLLSNTLSYADVPARMLALQLVGEPYTSTRSGYQAAVARFGPDLAPYYDILRAEEMLLRQAEARDHDGKPGRLTEMDALVAYLQVVGRRVGPAPVQAAQALDATARVH